MNLLTLCNFSAAAKPQNDFTPAVETVSFFKIHEKRRKKSTKKQDQTCDATNQ
jgi:hypothetical protein